MNSNKCIFVCFLLISVCAFSQVNNRADSFPAFQIKILNANYKDFIVVNKDIYAITSGDSLVIFNLQSNQHQQVISQVRAIAKTSSNTIFYVDNKMQLYTTTDFKDSKLIDSLKGNFPRILVDKNDNYVVVTSDGIFFKDNFYIPKIALQSGGYLRRGSLKSDLVGYPDLTYVDQKQRIWLTYDNGEFGENTYFFDLDNKVFSESKFLGLNDFFRKDQKFRIRQYESNLLDSFPNHIKKINQKLVYKFPNNLPISNGVKGISENREGEILISQSLMHFSVSGSLGMYKESEIKDFYYSYRIDQILEYKTIGKSKRKQTYLNEYIGCNSYNPFNNSFYYYSDKGFFRILKSKDVYSKELFFKPSITWTAGLSNAVGYQMNVKKFEFISENQLLFLTSNEGIGYFDGKTVKYFK